MNRRSEHILGYLVARDFRLGRALLTGVAVLALILVVRFFQPALIEIGGAANLSSVIPLCGAALGALICFRDSPASPNAWWASQPVPGSAMAMSKLIVVAAFGIGMALAAGLGSWAYGLDAMSALSAAGTVGFSSLGAGVAGILVAAAVGSRSVSGLVAVVLVALASSHLALTGRHLLVHNPATGLSAEFGLVALLVGVATTLRHYSRREASLMSRGLAFIAGLWVLTYSLQPPYVRSSQRDVASETIAFHAHPVQAIRCASDGSVTIGVSSRVAKRQVMLTDPMLTLSMNDGSTRTLRSPDWYQLVGVWGPLVTSQTTSNWKILGDTGEAYTRTSWILFNGTPSSPGLRCENVTSFTLDLAVSVREAREIARLPLEDAASASVGGYRLSLANVNVDGPQSELTLRASALSRDVTTDSSSLANLRYAVLQSRTDELIRLHIESGAASTVVNRDLPGLRHEGARLALAPYSREELPSRIDRAWFAGSTLIVSRISETAPQRQRLRVALQQVATTQD